MLPEKLAAALKTKQTELLDTGELYPPEKLETYYRLFRERFGPERLMQLEGEALLVYMHSFDERKASLVYWLEFKNDAEFPPIFGNIKGGSALKYGVYPSKDTGTWMTRGASNYPVEITVEQAVEIAYRHRDQLVRGAELLNSLSSNADDADYRALQQNMNEYAPDVSNTIWGHKYFSLLYPDKLDNFHTTYFQRFHLVKLLQPNIADERDGRYLMGGRFVALAHELDMPTNHLTTVLKALHGRPHRYFSILAEDTQGEARLTWDMQREGGYAAILWADLGDLSHLKHNSASKQLLRQLMDEFYMRADPGQAQGVFNFTTDITVGDVIVAFEKKRQQVVGVGRVTSPYYYEPGAFAPHRLKVDWQPTQPWQSPTREVLEKVGKEIFAYDNQVEIERRLLDAPALKGLESLLSPNAAEITMLSEDAESEIVSDLESPRLPRLFISYRRRNWPFTHLLVDELRQRLNAEIFVDTFGVDEFDFERSILRHLAESDAVLLVVSEDTFAARIHEENDWIRREIREALRHKKPIILVCEEGKFPPSDASLPEDIRAVTRSQGIRFFHEYVPAAVERLANFLAKIGVTGIEA